MSEAHGTTEDAPAGHAHAHGHGHSHEHGQGHTHDYAKENEKHFDATAQQYDARADVQELARRVREALVTAHPSLFDENKTRVLDYACGTGVLARELCQYVKSIVGVDISQGMVDQFNTRVANQGIAPEEMKAVRVELKGTPDELDGQKFDVVICSAAYHHFGSVDDVTRILVSFLKPGGSLLVVDILKEAGAFTIPDDYGHVVPHQGGFTEGEMRSLFEGAGLEDFSFQKAAEAKMHGHDVTFFLAKGTKPAAS